MCTKQDQDIAKGIQLHSKLNELLSCSCISPKSNDIPQHSRYIRKNTLQVKSIFTHP